LTLTAPARKATGLFTEQRRHHTPAAAATEEAPTLETSAFVCSNGVCQVGPGNVGVALLAALIATGKQCGTDGGTSPAVTKVASGSLPPGLQFVPTDGEWNLTGTPTQAGTYSFAVQLANVNDDSGQICGPTATQQLTITIGTGSSDRLVLRSAGLNLECGSYEPQLQLFESDANSGATHTMTVTSTGKQIGTFTESGESPTGADQRFNVPSGTFPSRTGQSVTVTDTLGGSATIPVRIVSGC
jgi:hypothetical protein